LQNKIIHHFWVVLIYVSYTSGNSTSLITSDISNFYLYHVFVTLKIRLLVIIMVFDYRIKLAYTMVEIKSNFIYLVHVYTYLISLPNNFFFILLEIRKSKKELFTLLGKWIIMNCLWCRLIFSFKSPIILYHVYILYI
jgi:hypothetical protein